MIRRHKYRSKTGSITLIHKTGIKLHISNSHDDYGEEEFNYYIVNSKEELTRFGFSQKDKLGILLEEPGWKVMYFENSNTYDCYGEKLEGKFIDLYRIGETYIFLLTNET